MTTQTTPNNASRSIPGIAKIPEKIERLRLKSANGTASTIVANVIGGILRNGSRSMHVLLTRYDDENNAVTNVLLVVAVGVGKIPVQLKSEERNRPKLTTLGRTSKVSGGLVNFLVY